MKTIAQQLNVTEFPFYIKDKNGNPIYCETTDEMWSKREYDTNGNEIYFESSSGHQSKKEYDSNGNCTYYENSNGYWWKQEYDSVGNIIYFEDSDGLIVDYRPKPCEGKLVEVDGIKYKLVKA